MKKVRLRTFETNSSSNNSFSLAEPKAEYIIPEIIQLDGSQCGRDFEHSTVDSKFSVLIYYCGSSDEVIELCSYLYSLGVKEIRLDNGPSRWFTIGEVEDKEIIQDILKDKEKIKAWLFDTDSYISGRDNNYDEW